MHGRRRRRKMYAKFWFENLKERGHSEDKHRREDNIGIDLRKIGWEVVDWMHVAQDKDHWWAVLNMVMKFREHKYVEFLDWMRE
jgi:hypothetical protein